jgi:hypothetical protein
MQCVNCGASIADKAIVCYRCGAPTALPEAPIRPAPTGSRVPWALVVIVAVVVAAAVAAAAWYFTSCCGS